MEKEKRENGYYWVRHKFSEDLWQPAEWLGNVWLMLGSEERFDDIEMVEIGELIMKKQEAYQNKEIEQIKKLEEIVGKTVKVAGIVRLPVGEGYDLLKMIFTDNSFIRIRTWDFEGFRSGLQICQDLECAEEE